MTADRLGSALVLIAAVMVTITVLWQASDADIAPSTSGLHPMLHGLTAGAAAAFLAADLFNLYVWFEVALICSLGLLVQGGALRQLDAALARAELDQPGLAGKLALQNHAFVDDGGHAIKEFPGPGEFVSNGKGRSCQCRDCA